MYETINKNKNITYVFFDIFDTILSRKIEPEYVKKIWANYILNTFNLNMNMEDLYLKRNQIETKLGEENHNKGNDFEFKYIDMITEIYKELSIDTSFENFYNISKQTEIEIESKVLYKNNDIIDLIKKLKKDNKKIICISDMYLSKEMITKIFTNLNIIKMFDDIYVSSEYLKNKKSGDLYKIVLKTLKIKPTNCIMIGDNINGDYNIPKSLKIESLLLDRKEKYKDYEDYKNNNNSNIVYKELLKLSNNPTDNFEHTIFSLYRFIEKIYFKLIEEGKKEVFFLSREGEYLKKLFDYYNENIFNKKIKTHYIYVSRKSTYLPSLQEIEKEDFSALLNQYSYITINEFLKSLNLIEEEIEKINKENIEKDFNKKIPFFKDSKELKELKQNKAFKKIYEENRKKQNQNFKKYIKDLTKEKELYVVDIGWNGSIQNNIQNILGKEYIIKGMYFGLQKKYFDEKDIKYGLIFSNYPTPSKDYYLYSENRSIFEIILGASHGSANKYIEKNNKIEVELFKKIEEEQIYINIIKPIQDKMFTTFKELTGVLQNKYYNNIKINKLINKIHFNMVFNPTKTQYDFFNKIYHYENFGVFEFTKFNLKNKLTIKKHIKENIKFILKYKEYFYDTYWPISKLHNNKMYLAKILYKTRKKQRFQKSNII